MKAHSTLNLALLMAAAMVISARVEAARPSAEQALRLRPLQKHVDYDQPSADVAAKCTIEPRKEGDRSAWVVESPDGLVLRKFADTNGDNTVDQWSYYKDGLEVYRDIDSDFDKRADQFRWFHTEGSRWGIDEDADGKIDRWRRLSAEEASAEAVRALADGDSEAYARLMLTSDELKQLGLGEEKTEQLAGQIAEAVDSFRKLAAEQRAVTEQTEWVQFSGSQPGVVPAGTGGSTEDIEVYENVVAVVETEGEHGQVHIGTLIRRGPVWRLIDVPRPMAGEETGRVARGFFFQPPMPQQQAAAAGGPSEQTQELLTKLEQLDQQAGAADSPEKQSEYIARRAELVGEIAEATTAPAERKMWLRQLADMLSAAIQEGQLPDGAERLAELFNKLKQDGADDDILAYVKFRQYAAEYALALRQPKANFQSVQEQWLEDLEQFVEGYPKSPDAAEAMLQLAIAHEFAGEESKAEQWYGRVVEDLPDSAAAKKAAGARRRLNAEGKVIELGGKSPDGRAVQLDQYRGKVVLIQYWATWCEPCKAHMAALKELVAKYGRNFTVIGVNLDNNVQDLAEYLKSNRLPWPQIYEEGGLDSGPANRLGILTLPTMLLVDQQGRVVDRNVQVGQLEGQVKELLSAGSAKRSSSRR